MGQNTVLKINAGVAQWLERLPEIFGHIIRNDIVKIG